MATKRNTRREVNTQVFAAQNNYHAEVEYKQDVRGLAKNKRIAFSPSTEKQEQMVDAVENNPVSVVIGPAGVGKTFVAASLAAQYLYRREVDEIILTRANVTVGESIGMLPGTVEEKMAPLLAPILQALERQMGKQDYEYCLAKGKIKMLPFEYVRGRSFNAFVIVDEAQNLTPKDVQALCTRYETGRVMLLGDPFQHDLVNVEPGINWLKEFVFRSGLDIPIIECGISDVVRSGFVRKFLEALYRDLENKKFVDAAKPKAPAKPRAPRKKATTSALLTG